MQPMAVQHIGAASILNLNPTARAGCLFDHPGPPLLPATFSYIEAFVRAASLFYSPVVAISIQVLAPFDVQLHRGVSAGSGPGGSRGVRDGSGAQQQRSGAGVGADAYPGAGAARRRQQHQN